MSKGLRLLKEFQSMTLLTPCAQMKLKIIEKELKALEIIKEHTLYCENVNCFVFTNMSDEETNLLKEVLL